jgi:hypothetical protein
VGNFIIEQEGSAPRVAEKVLEMCWGAAPLLLDAIAGTVFGLYLGAPEARRSRWTAEGLVSEYRAARWCRPCFVSTVCAVSNSEI